VPRRDRTLPKEFRWRGSKCVSRVLAPLVPDRATPRTQESHPSTLDGLGAHNEWFNLHFPLDVTPLGGDHLTSGLSTPTTRAPSMRGVTGWVSGPRRAPPRALARTCSARAGVALLRGGPCGAPRAPRSARGLGTCPMCTPRGCGRSTRCSAAARAREDPALGTGRRHEGAHCTPLHAPYGVPGGRAPKPKPPMPDCERDVHAGRARGSRTARGCHPRPRRPRAGQRCRPCARPASPACSSRCAGGRPDHQTPRPGHATCVGGTAAAHPAHARVAVAQGLTQVHR